jgi:hypothetical protein
VCSRTSTTRAYELCSVWGGKLGPRKHTNGESNESITVTFERTQGDASNAVNIQQNADCHSNDTSSPPTLGPACKTGPGSSTQQTTTREVRCFVLSSGDENQSVNSQSLPMTHTAPLLLSGSNLVTLLSNKKKLKLLCIHHIHHNNRRRSDRSIQRTEHPVCTCPSPLLLTLFNTLINHHGQVRRHSSQTD